MTERKPRSLSELAQDAIHVQDACNLSGVAQGFARAMLDLRAHVHNTTEANTHPLAVLWIDKVVSLSQHGTRAFAIDQAYTWAREQGATL